MVVSPLSVLGPRQHYFSMHLCQLAVQEPSSHVKPSSHAYLYSFGVHISVRYGPLRRRDCSDIRVLFWALRCPASQGIGFVVPSFSTNRTMLRSRLYWYLSPRRYGLRNGDSPLLEMCCHCRIYGRIAYNRAAMS